MGTINSIMKSIGSFFDSIAKVRVQSTLLGMDRRWLENNGYSYELLLKGVDAWPWREIDTETIAANDSEHTKIESVISVDLTGDELAIDREDIATAAENDSEYGAKKVAA